MLEEIYLFGRGLWSFSYTVPIPIQISAYLVLLVIITALVYIFKDTLAGGAYRDTYMWYYFIAVFNILNICAVLYYYHTKTGSFVGAPGVQGVPGTHGMRGNNISCSLCTQNIYLQPTQGYDLITELDFVRLADIVVGNDLAQSLKDMDAAIGGSRTNFFDFSQLGTNLAAGTFDFNNPLVSNLLLLSTYGDYSLIQYINQALGLAVPGGLAGTIERPARKIGQFALGDIAFGGQEKYSATAYMANGDIRCPSGFTPICSFATAKGKDGRLEYYTIYKPQPPQLSRDDIRSARLANDISRQPTDNQFVSIGHIAYPMITNTSNTRLSGTGGQNSIVGPDMGGLAQLGPDPLLFACVKSSCCERISTDKLRFVCVYPGVKAASQSPVASRPTPEIPADIIAAQQTQTGNPTEQSSTTTTTTIPTKLNDRIMESRPENEGYFSIWRTPINTMIVKFSNSTWEDGLFLPEIMYEAAETIYEDDGTIKSKIRTKIQGFLTKIKLDQVIVATVIFGATLEQVKVDLGIFANRFCLGPNAEILATPAIRSSVGPGGMTPTQISQALQDIQKAIDDSTLTTRPQINTTRRRLTTLFADQESRRLTASRPGEISYNCRNQYDKIKKLIGKMTSRIENAQNLWDVILAVLPQGLTQRIYKSKLTDTQKRLIDLVSVLVPPVEDVWMIKDECLVLERPDQSRIDWENNLESEIATHKKLVRLANKSGIPGITNKSDKPDGSDDTTDKSDDTTDKSDDTTCIDINAVNTAVNEGMRLISEQIGNIPDYMGKLNKGDFSELTPNEIKIVLGIFRQVNSKIISNCGNI